MCRVEERGKFRSRRFSKRVPEQEDPPSVNVSKSEEDGVVVSGNGKVLRDDAVVEELSEVVASEFVSDFVSDSVPILVYEDFAICFKISGEGSILIGDLSSVHQEVQVIGKELGIYREDGHLGSILKRRKLMRMAAVTWLRKLGEREEGGGEGFGAISGLLSSVGAVASSLAAWNRV
ncbi:hypothetical protein ACOSP7_013028 [Xanthoceras sorbifolium]